ncbi:MAG: energy-dependent translational throttle protein EttA [Nitrospinae bacterium]|nr:energy-dependent translational throttle protein EttA [Nitrospinota bacterium]
MAGEYVFTIGRLSKSYGQKTVFENINLAFYHGAKIGVVGENGTGKSTLLKIMAGVEHEFMGTAEPKKGIRIGYLSQEPALNPQKDVRGNVEEAFAEIKSLIAEYEKLSEAMASPMSDSDMEKALERMGRLQDQIDSVNGWELDRQVEVAMDALLLPPDDMDVTKLSGGERRRVALCKLLLTRPDILLLDEPTNHLDAETVDWLEAQLREYPGNVIVVTHDRYFLDNITKWILELYSSRGIPFEGNYSAWLEAKAARVAQEEKQAKGAARHMEQELAWIRSNPGARRAKSKARVREYEKLASQKSNIEKNTLDIQIARGPALGDQVIEAVGLSKAYGDRMLFSDVNFIIPKGGIVGLIGPNGVGKTTLFRMITGEEKPTGGSITVGQTVRLSHVDQHRDDLDGSKTVFEEITGGTDQVEVGGVPVNSRSYVGSFNFKGPDQQKKVANLSGGERNRVHLAKLLRRGGNVILLDEPTNDLDVTTLRNLEDAILDFPGCVLVISHDRFFLDRICTHLLVFEGEGKVRWFEGNFAEYEEARRKELGGKTENRRSKYKKLTLR